MTETIKEHCKTVVKSPAEMRADLGTFIVDDAADVALQLGYRGKDDRVLINTVAEGIRGPQTGTSHERGKPGTAFIDLALTPQLARRVHDQLGRVLEEYENHESNIDVER